MLERISNAGSYSWNSSIDQSVGMISDQEKVSGPPKKRRTTSYCSFRIFSPAIDYPQSELRTYP
jgi:hypothetical protein